MNFKTTLILLIALLACGVTYLIYKPDPKAIREARLAETKSEPDNPVEQNLVEEGSFGTPVKVACKLRRQSEEWVFEKRREGDKDLWDITAPMKGRASGWQVDSIHRRMLEMKYEIVYAGGAGVTDAETGLADPEARVTLTDDKGKTLTFEIGKSPARGQTYARLAGNKDVVVAKADLMNVFKDSILEYRDPKLFDFAAADVVRFEIVDKTGEGGAPVTYLLVREGDGWVFEAPFSGKATAEVETAVTTFANARMSKWKDSDPATLPVYGLDHPALSLTVTVEKKTTRPKTPSPEDAAEDDANDNADAAAPEEETVVETFVHTLHLSKMSPLGEDTSLYARVGDEPAVGTLPKTTTDKLKPIESKWRDLRLTTAPVARANRVRITTGGRTCDLIEKDGEWVFAESGQAADADAVKELLKAVGGLNARTFVPMSPGDEASFGLDAPSVDLTLTIPGQDEPERFRIGGPSDGELKRLFYVRRGESTSIAKVRAEDLKLLRRPETDYRSRQIFSLGGGSIERIDLAYDNPVDEGRVQIALEPRNGLWTLVEPVEAAASKERADKLVASLRNVRGLRFAGEGGDPAKYGLTDPTAILRLTYLEKAAQDSSVVPEDRKKKDRAEVADPEAETADPAPSQGGPRDALTQEGGDTGAGQEAGGEAETVKAPAEARSTVEFQAGTAGGSYYLKRADAPGVYEISKELFDRFIEEYRDDRVLSFTDSEVAAFSIRGGGQTHAFTKREGQWVLAAEPDLSLDQKAVTTLLVNLSDLRTARYVRYTGSQAADFGLADPAVEAEVTLDDGRKLTLSVSAETCPKDASKRRYATRGDGGIFLLTSEEIARFEVRLDAIEAK